MKTPNSDLINLYLDEHIKIARGFPVLEVLKLVEAVGNTYKNQGVIFTFGNGGGASIANHFASDLSIHPFVSEDKHTLIEIQRLDVHCLNDSPSLLTRLANDIGYDWVFVEQLNAYSITDESLVIAFSTSGNSLNIVYALAHAKQNGLRTALIGGKDGGKAKEFADICILIPGHSDFPGQVGANDNCFHIEDFQSSIAHMVTGILKERIDEKLAL